MAHSYTCQRTHDEAACEDPASLSSCKWNSNQNTCLPDLVPATLNPLICPGSRAQSLIGCLNYDNVGDCGGMEGCVKGHGGECVPAWLVSEAKNWNVSVEVQTRTALLKFLSGGSEGGKWGGGGRGRGGRERGGGREECKTGRWNMNVEVQSRNPLGTFISGVLKGERRREGRVVREGGWAREGGNEDSCNVIVEVQTRMSLGRFLSNGLRGGPRRGGGGRL